MAGGTIEAMRDTCIPIFNNRVNDYREWRQRITLYKRKLVLQGKEKEAILNLLTSVHGVAWKQVEHMVESVVESSDGFDRWLATLDAAFKYDSRVEMPRALEKFFYQLTRRGDQTLLSYCSGSDHREQLREIEKFGIQIPDSVSGWMLLRRSQLTLEQRQLVQSQVGAEMKTAKVEEAMYYLFGQDYPSRVDQSTKWQKNPQGKGQRWFQRKSQQGYSAEDYDPEYDEETEDGFALLEEEPYEEEPTYEETEDYEAFDDELFYQDDGWAEESDPQLEEAYATYLDARRQFASIKASRGFYPVVALTTPEMPTSSSSSTTTSQRPIPKGGKGKQGKGKNKSPPQKGSLCSASNVADMVTLQLNVP